MKDLPNNLRISPDGVIFCEDGQDVATYILSQQSKPFTTSAIVLVNREIYLKLVQDAWAKVHLIQAA